MEKPVENYTLFAREPTPMRAHQRNSLVSWSEMDPSQGCDDYEPVIILSSSVIHIVFSHYSLYMTRAKTAKAAAPKMPPTLRELAPPVNGTVEVWLPVVGEAYPLEAVVDALADDTADDMTVEAGDSPENADDLVADEAVDDAADEEEDAVVAGAEVADADDDAEAEEEEPEPTEISDAHAPDAVLVASAELNAASMQDLAALAAACSPDGAMAIKASAKESVSDIRVLRSPVTTVSIPSLVKVGALAVAALRAATMLGIKALTALRIEEPSESESVEVDLASLVPCLMAESRALSALMRRLASATLL